MNIIKSNYNQMNKLDIYVMTPGLFMSSVLGKYIFRSTCLVPKE